MKIPQKVPKIHPKFQSKLLHRKSVTLPWWFCYLDNWSSVVSCLVSFSFVMMIRKLLHTQFHIEEVGNSWLWILSIAKTFRTVFENYRKSRIQYCERSELRLHFESQKFIKYAKTWSILASFWKPEACGQTVLPHRSILIRQKLMVKAKKGHFEEFPKVLPDRSILKGDKNWWKMPKSKNWQMRHFE